MTTYSALDSLAAAQCHSPLDVVVHIANRNSWAADVADNRGGGGDSDRGADGVLSIGDAQVPVIPCLRFTVMV